ncbi:MAG: malto-oligosyltrehalose trehalohydrolase [Bryobacteraceae bacterium]
MSSWEPTLGAIVHSGATQFRVWAPEVKSVEVMLEGSGGAGEARSLTRGPDGFHQALIPGVTEGDRYRYRLDGQGPFPDPASRFQPEGVHGPSQVVDARHFPWTDFGWTGIPLEEISFYELHIGTFTPEGTFAAAVDRLPYLRDLGINAVELMPLADFPGRWNWGYDGVAPFAPARCYGSPADLRRLIDRAHALGLAVFLDVVYNHLGPDGAYQGTFSPYYYSKTATTAWGAAINFDGPQCEPVRDYFIENALHWIHEYHLDGLRLDATHAIVDTSGRQFVASLNGAVKASLKDAERQACIIAEDERNLAEMLLPESEGGWALDGVWADDFHHQMRRLLAGDSESYFEDFEGTAAGVAATARNGWFYTGQHAPHFGGPRGMQTTGIALSRFVVCLQNHDQIGNRAFGERLHHQIDLAAWRAASALLLLLPETPLLFMGQEWAATTPFLFFTDHGPALGPLVTEGRRKEFSRFSAFSNPVTRKRIPDPQQACTFEACRLNWAEMGTEPHASVFRLYQRLLKLRRSEPGLGKSATGFHIEAAGPDALTAVRNACDGSALLLVVRLRGSGPIDWDRAARAWDPVFTTEDASFAPDSHPIRFDSDGPIQFSRPGAVVFRSRAAAGEEN